MSGDRASASLRPHSPFPLPPCEADSLPTGRSPHLGWGWGASLETRTWCRVFIWGKMFPWVAVTEYHRLAGLKFRNSGTSLVAQQSAL